MVSHRLLLTSEETDTQRDILEIIQKCTLAFQEKLFREEGKEHNSTTTGLTAIEGGDNPVAVDDGTKKLTI